MTTPQNYGAPWRVQPGDGEWLVIDRYGAVVLHCEARGIAEFVVAAPELLAALEQLSAVVMLAGIPDPEARIAANRAVDAALAALAKARTA